MASASHEFTTAISKVRNAIPAIVEALGWTIKSVNDGLIEVGTSTSLASWGEKVAIRLTAGKKGTTVVTIESDATAQLFTWGKNEENVASFLERLKKQLG